MIASRLITILALAATLIGCSDASDTGGYSRPSSYYSQPNNFENWQRSNDNFHQNQINDGHMTR